MNAVPRPPRPSRRFGDDAELWGRIVVHREGPHDAVVIKPAGLSVELPEDARRGVDGRSLLAWARARWPQASPRLPHRLDRLSCGIVVVALDAEAAAFHGEAIRQGRWRKFYLTRLAGTSGMVSLVGTHRVHLRVRGGRAEVVRSGGQPSVLEVLDVAPAPERSGECHALIRLDTGRFHQIRATMAHLGAPVSGDPLYDPQAATRGAEPWLEHALLRLPRLPQNAGQGDEVVWRPADADREPVHPRLLERLAQLAA